MVFSCARVCEVFSALLLETCHAAVICNMLHLAGARSCWVGLLARAQQLLLCATGGKYMRNI
jgi:hypothetical protein